MRENFSKLQTFEAMSARVHALLGVSKHAATPVKISRTSDTTSPASLLVRHNANASRLRKQPSLTSVHPAWRSASLSFLSTSLILVIITSYLQKSTTKLAVHVVACDFRVCKNMLHCRATLAFERATHHATYYRKSTLSESEPQRIVHPGLHT